MFILCISHLGRKERSWEATKFYQVLLLINKLQPNTWPYYNAFGMANEAFCDSETELHIRFNELHKNTTTMARATYNSPYFQLLHVLYTNASWFQHLIFGQTNGQVLVKNAFHIKWHNCVVPLKFLHSWSGSKWGKSGRKMS